jgi:hypothetical protein
MATITTVTIARPRWAGYLAGLSAHLAGEQAFIEVASLALGDQVEARWLPLLAITYDHKDDIVVFDLGDLKHIVARPVGLDVMDEAGAVSSIEVVDAQGARHIARLREPLMLAKAG